MAFQNFYDLEAWKAARKFKRRIFELMTRFPTSERYELISQLSRGSQTVMANIAEGHARQSPKNELHFTVMARGSLTEVLNHLIEARDCGSIDDRVLMSYKNEWNGVRRILNGYVSCLRGRIKPPKPEAYVSEDSIEISPDRSDAPGISDANFLRNLDEE